MESNSRNYLPCCVSQQPSQSQPIVNAPVPVLNNSYQQQVFATINRCWTQQPFQPIASAPVSVPNNGCQELVFNPINNCWIPQPFQPIASAPVSVPNNDYQQLAFDSINRCGLQQPFVFQPIRNEAEHMHITQNYYNVTINCNKGEPEAE